MIIYPSTIKLLQQYKFLRSAMAQRLQEANPLDYEESVRGVDESKYDWRHHFLQQFTPEQIAKSPKWSFEYVRSRTPTERFAMAEEKMKHTGYWTGYLYNLLHLCDDDHMDDRIFAVRELHKVQKS